MNRRALGKAFLGYAVVVTVFVLAGFDGRPPDPPSPPPSPAAYDPVDPSPFTTKDRTYLPHVPLDGPANLFGTVVVVDEQGAEHTGLDGEFMLFEWKGPRAGGRPVRVKGGRFEARVEGDGRLSFDQVTLGNRHAHVEGRHEIPADGKITVRALWHRRVRLRVVDDATGADLERIEVKQVWNTTVHDAVVHPGTEIPLRPYTLDGTSPMLLPEGAEGDTYWVHVPGYAWALVRANLGGEQTARLVRGGTCTLALESVPAGRPLLVRLYGDDDPHPVAEARPDGQGRCPFDDLRPGTYEARAELARMPEAAPLAAERFTVAADDAKTVTLRLTEPPPAPLEVPFAGTVALPPSWGRVGGIGVRVGPRNGELESVPVRGAEWNAGRVRAGEVYEVAVSPFGVRASFEVGAGGRTDAVVEIPEPADVEVQLVDAEGKPVDVESLTWSRPPPEGLRRRNAYGATPGATGVFLFRAPAGEVLLSCDDAEVELDEARLVLKPGHNLRIMHIARRAVLKIRLLDGGRPVRLSSEYLPVVGTAEEAFEAMKYVHDGESVQVVLPGGGTYTLDLPPLDAFAPIPRRTVELAPGETRTLNIPLERR